jgi:hypothetical protein
MDSRATAASHERLELGRRIWRFVVLSDEPQPVDGLLLFGSDELEIPRRAAALYPVCRPKWIIASGSRGERTKEWPLTEAETFAAVLKGNGVPDEVVHLETEATHTLENVLKSAEIIRAKGLPCERVGLVSKELLQLRAYLTAVRNLPGAFFNFPPPSTFEQRLAERPDLVERLGYEIGRIKMYSAMGHIAGVEIPYDISAASAYIMTDGSGVYPYE